MKKERKAVSIVFAVENDCNLFKGKSECVTIVRECNLMGTSKNDSLNKLG